MHAVALFDDVEVSIIPESSGISLKIEQEAKPGESSFVNSNDDNLAVRAAKHLLAESAIEPQGEIAIKLKKNIPVAAGLAGGSSDAAAVLLALNKLLTQSGVAKSRVTQSGIAKSRATQSGIAQSRATQSGITKSRVIAGSDPQSQTVYGLPDLIKIGAKIGADVPFCLASNAKCNPQCDLADDPFATVSALCEGIGDIITPLDSVSGELILIKPDITVSTAEIYKAFDNYNSEELHLDEFVNDLQPITESRYPEVARLIKVVAANCKNIPDTKVFMSGSGPTVCVFSPKFPSDMQNSCLLSGIECGTVPYITYGKCRLC
jgi:4-diphosphocytidyl-2-C-methyl-D-erythritol kinase